MVVSTRRVNEEAAEGGRSGVRVVPMLLPLVQGQRIAPAIGAVIGYSFTVSYLLLKLIDMTLGLRVSEEHEEVGLDLSQHSEAGYAW